MFKYIVASLLLATLCQANNPIPFQQCTDGTVPPNEVRIDICDSNPCKLSPGQEINTFVDFTNRKISE